MISSTMNEHRQTRPESDPTAAQTVVSGYDFVVL